MNNNTSVVNETVETTETTQSKAVKQLEMNVITRTEINIDVIRLHKDDGTLNWKEISKLHDISVEFITEFIDYIHVSSIAKHHVPDSDVYGLLKDKFNYSDWEVISENLAFLEYPELVSEFAGYIHWNVVSKLKNTPASVLRDFPMRLDWDRVTVKRKFTDEEMVEFEQYINWKELINNRRYTSMFEKLENEALRQILNTKLGAELGKVGKKKKKKGKKHKN